MPGNHKSYASADGSTSGSMANACRAVMPGARTEIPDRWCISAGPTIPRDCRGGFGEQKCDRCTRMPAGHCTRAMHVYHQRTNGRANGVERADRSGRRFPCGGCCDGRAPQRECANRADRDLRHSWQHTCADFRCEQCQDAGGSGARTQHFDGHRQYQDLSARRGHHCGGHRQFGGRLPRRYLHRVAGILVHKSGEHRSRRGGQGPAGNPVRAQHHRRSSSDRHEDTLIAALRRPDFGLRQLQYVRASLRISPRTSSTTTAIRRKVPVST